MRQGWSWGRVTGGLIGLALAACGSESSNDSASLVPPPGEYLLGGQTGSLVPDCGVAPLSAGGITVPVGDALAVVYGRGCPEELAAQLALTGPGERPVALTLETLGDGTYLVRAAESLAAGSYDLGGAGEPSRLSVAAEVSALPAQLGELRPLVSPVDCPDSLVFELRLSPEAQAYLPLMRWLVSVDAGDEQLWVDYGALELDALDAERATLRLPRCGPSRCLDDGAHELRVRAEVAGEELASGALSVGFDVPCPEASPLSDAAPSDAASDSGCSLGKTASFPHASIAWWCGVAAAVLAARRRRY